MCGTRFESSPYRLFALCIVQITYLVQIIYFPIKEVPLSCLFNVDSRVVTKSQADMHVGNLMECLVSDE